MSFSELTHFNELEYFLQRKELEFNSGGVANRETIGKPRVMRLTIDGDVIREGQLCITEALRYEINEYMRNHYYGVIIVA